MNKIISKVQEIIENYKTDKDFKKDIFGGIKLVITDKNVDNIYNKHEYESICRNGPYLLPVRGIKDEVYDWCLKAKGTIRVPHEFRYDFGVENFYFSHRKDAEEFKKTFNLNCNLYFNGQDLSKVDFKLNLHYPTGIFKDVVNLGLVAMIIMVSIYFGENAKF